MTKVIKYAIQGAGNHAISHAIPAKGILGIELAGIFDPSQESQEKFQRKYGSEVHVFKTEADLLRNCDAVLILTPDKFHIPNLKSALEAGKHVMIEKPLASTTEELFEMERLLQFAEDRGLVVTSCHPRRFDPPFLWLKQNLQRLISRFGKVTGFRFTFSYHIPSSDWKHGRSLMLDHLNHEIDMANFLFGFCDVEAVMLEDGFDRYEVVGERKDGIGLNFEGSRRLVERKFLEWATVEFEHIEVTVDSHTGIATITNFITEEVEEEICGQTDYEIRVARVMENFIGTINGTSTNYLSRKEIWMNNWLGVHLLSAQ